MSDNQEDFDFSEEARNRDTRIFEILDEEGQGTGRFGFALSAAKSGGKLRNRGEDAEETRQTDLENFQAGTVHGNWIINPPVGVSDTEYIRGLLQSDTNYAAHLPPDYDDPGYWGILRGTYRGGDDPNEYNSNGYQNGLIRSGGGRPPILNDDSFREGDDVLVAPLYNDPVPGEFFDAPIGPMRPDPNTKYPIYYN